MTIPVPFACNPGDKLRVIRDKPCGTDLMTGDLVTVMDTGIHVSNGLPVPVVQVATAHGPQFLTFDAVLPATDLPAYAPAEPDEVVDAFFFGMLGADDDLRDWAVTARTELAKNDPKPVAEPNGGGTAVAEAPTRRVVGRTFSFDDGEDDLEVTYYEQDCPTHGREGGFHFSINDEEEVIIPAAHIDNLIRFLFVMKKHSERPPEE